MCDTSGEGFMMVMGLSCTHWSHSIMTIKQLGYFDCCKAHTGTTLGYRDISLHKTGVSSIAPSLHSMVQTVKYERFFI